MEKNNLFEQIPCPLCGNEKLQIISSSQYPSDLSVDKLRDFYRSSSDQKLVDQLVSCDSCGLVYVNPRIYPGVIIKAYSDAVDPTFVEENPSRILTFKKALKQITKDMGITPQKSKLVLDVGCAGGAFPKAADELGFSVIGVEPSKWMCDFAKKEFDLDIRQGTLADQKFPESNFDMITLWDVIEHLPDPSEVLVQIHSLLKADGVLVVNYPDYDSWAARILKEKWPFLLSVHLFYYTPNTIKRQLEQCGFEVLKIRPYWQMLSLGYVLQRASVYFKLFGWLEKISKKMGVSSLQFKYNMGQTLVIARKKT